MVSLFIIFALMIAGFAALLKAFHVEPKQNGTIRHLKPKSMFLKCHILDDPDISHYEVVYIGIERIIGILLKLDGSILIESDSGRAKVEPLEMVSQEKMVAEILEYEATAQKNDRKQHKEATCFGCKFIASPTMVDPCLSCLNGDAYQPQRA